MNLLRPLLPLASSTRRRITAVLLGLLAAAHAPAATYTWNNTGTDWATGADWSSTGVPTSTDTATFNPSGLNPASTIVNPVVTGAQSLLSLGLANNPALGTYTFTGTGSLTLGGTGSTGLTTRGYGTTIFNGPTLAGSGAAPNTANFTITTDTGVDLTGTSATTTNIGNFSLYGGTFTLDDTSSTTTRVPTTNTIALNGGTLSVLGNAAGVTVNAGILNVTAANAPGEGYATISVTEPAGATSGTTLNFANSGAGYSLRTTTSLAYDFVGVGGVLGSAGGPRVTFTVAPNITTTTGTGMFSGGAVSSSTVGFAIATDSSGTGWATYVAPSGSGATAAGGVEILAPSTTATTATNLQALTAASVADFNPGTGVTVTTSAVVTTGSILFDPSGAGDTLNLGTASTASLKTNAILLTGSNDFSITGGNLDGTATKIIFVANPSTTLNISSILDGAGSNGNPVDFNGPGFLNLTGTSSQFTVTGTNRLNLIGGTVRANATQLGGFGATGGTGVFAFRGGVLEITGGSDGTGASADFTRPINATNTAGDVNWESTTAGDSEGGSGGFSAYGSAASVNLGGSASPSTLTWGVTGSGFVQDGFALIFGSTKSNARLDFLNPVALDSGTPGAYLTREINVIGGAGGDATRFAGVISGSSTTDLVKSGTGTLQLAATNTYAGNTLVEAGTLALVGTGNVGSGNVSLASATTFDISGSSGSVALGSTQTLAGNGTVNTGANTLTISGTLNPGFSTGELTIDGTVAVTGFTNFQIGGNTTSLYSQIALGAGSTLNLGSSTIDLTTTYTPTAGDTIDLVSLGGGATITGTPTIDGTSLPGNLYWNTSTFDTTGDIVATPVPEPAVYAAAFAAAALALASWRRTRGKSA